MNYIVHSTLSKEELDKRKYAFPEERKFPLPDKDHVLSAIKFFNYISPDKEEKLAKEILKRIKEYGMTDINVGEDNRFSKYYKPKNDTLAHSKKGEKWKNHKYIDIKNGRYIYPSFMYKKEAKRINEQGAAIAKNRKSIRDNKYTDYYNVEMNKRQGKYSESQYRKAKADIRNKYKKIEDSLAAQSSANAQAKIKNLYKYQNSSNYKNKNAFDNFLAKGKSFLDKLFKKNKKPKRSTEEALKRNTKLRAQNRTIKRKGLAKYGTM